MFTVSRILVVVAFCTAFTPSLRAADSAPAELHKLHALLLIDSKAENVAEADKVDGRRMTAFLRGGVPKERLALTILDGDDLTEEKIVKHYEHLKTGPADCLFCFYSGHGGTDPDQGHFLALTNTGPFFRTKLRSLIQAHKPALSVIVTDCCSSCVRVDSKRNVLVMPGAARQLDPALRCLFFRHRGLVDVTGASGNAAYGNDDIGGMFTSSLVKVIQRHSGLLGNGREQFVTWKDMFPQVQQETEVTYVHWVKGDDPNNPEVKQKTQKPQAFDLPDDPTRPSLTLHNNGKETVHYRYRWGKDGNWSAATLPPEGNRMHSVPATIGSTDRWFLEVKFDDGETGTLKVGKTYKYSHGPKKTRGLEEDVEDQ